MLFMKGSSSHSHREGYTYEPKLVTGLRVIPPLTKVNINIDIVSNMRYEAAVASIGN
jgi:hypothetical protein